MKARSHRKLHEQPMSQIDGSARLLSEPYPAEWYGTKRDHTVRHESRDPDYIAEARLDATPSWEPDMNLADYECRHGKLPTDNNIVCVCWGRDLETDLRERLRGLTREQAVSVLLAA